MKKLGNILTGDRPTGKLHIGHFVGSLRERVRIQNDNMSLSYVAEIEGKIVGFVFGRMISHYEHFGERGYADLEAIYIHPDYQGLGMGNKFKQIFVDWAKSNGATKFVIGVLKDNHNARKVYEKWGGKLDEYTQPFVKLGVEYDEVFYTFDLY